MPELPEVEVTRLAILPHLRAQTISHIHIRQPRLRWPVPEAFASHFSGACIAHIKRRAKYLIFQTSAGDFLLHLGMSGRLCLVDHVKPAEKHDHVDFTVREASLLLRYTDPRRFGCILGPIDATTHPLLKMLGPEPLEHDFDGDYLYAQTRARKANIKTLIMDQHVVCGVGNIYACEALFLSGIHPERSSASLSRDQTKILATTIKDVLQKAIHCGGSTIRDFRHGEGNFGYFQQQHYVYGREGLPCQHCQTPLEDVRIQHRTSVYCPKCQQ